jgi:hypothetical protein
VNVAIITPQQHITYGLFKLRIVEKEISVSIGRLVCDVLTLAVGFGEKT